MIVVLSVIACIALVQSQGTSAPLAAFSDHQSRNRLLLDQISKERIRFDAPAENKIATGETEGSESTRSWMFRNSTGSPFRCFVDETIRESSEDTIMKTKDATPVFSQEALAARIELLRGTCVTHDGGWWVTRWCHAVEVRQVHYEGAREVTAYSLGTFNGGEVRMADIDKPLSLPTDASQSGSPSSTASKTNVPLFYSEMFLNGNICHELGEARKTEVRMYCCPKDKVVSLVSLQETTTCSYTMTLCWATLCEAGLPPLAPNSRDNWAATRPLTGLCFRHTGDNGVTNEVCFEKSVRSFREVKETARKGAAKGANQRIVETDQKLFGTFDSALTDSMEGKDLDPSGEVIQTDEHKREVIQVYSKGEPCSNEDPIEPESYHASVKIACFLTRSSPPGIVSVRWISKCAKLILMHSPGLCDADDEHRLRLRMWRRRLNRQQQQHQQVQTLSASSISVDNGVVDEEYDDSVDFDSDTELTRVSCIPVEE